MGSTMACSLVFQSVTPPTCLCVTYASLHECTEVQWHSLSKLSKVLRTMYTILTLANYAWRQIMPAEQQPKQEQQDVKWELITHTNLY